MIIRAVIFDVDGVLIDSLAPHLKFCQEKSQEYGLDLVIPNEIELRNLVRRGVRISPMKYFFLAVGFPEQQAQRAELDYQSAFLQKNTLAVFPGVDSMLSRLASSGEPLGFVTDNVKLNVESALGVSLSHFRPEHRFTKDHPGGLSKVEALGKSVNNFGIPPNETIYVGDQPADWRAASAIGMQFLGVTYGWGISGADVDFPTVDLPEEIGTYVLNVNER